jgi:cytoskeleton protein RodZ
MTSVGETLRGERLKRKLDLDTISEELKISARFLRFIEADQFDKLPGGVFARSFVRQYAHLLGLDEDELAGQVERTLAPSDSQHYADRPKPGGVVQIQVPKVDEWETVGDKRFRWSGLLSAVALVVVMLVCSAVYAWLQRPRPAPTSAQSHSQTPAPARITLPQTPPQTAPQPVPSAPAPAVVADAKPTESPVEAKAAEVKAVEVKPADVKPVEAEPTEEKPAEATTEAKSTTPAPPNPNATVHVQITAEEQSWVQARADGKFAFAVSMDAHTTRTVEGVTEVTVKVGNAGGVTILLNGKPIGPAGPEGQVRTLQFTSGGFQIVPAKPPSAPAKPASTPAEPGATTPPATAPTAPPL